MIAKWIIVGYLSVLSIVSIARTGKPPARTTPGAVAVATALNSALIVAICIWWQA
jgi:hypothetical protein